MSVVAAPKTRVRPARMRLRDDQLATTRLRRFAWRMECDTCPYESLAPNRAGAKANEAAHREWHAHAERASMAGPV